MILKALLPIIGQLIALFLRRRDEEEEKKKKIILDLKAVHNEKDKNKRASMLNALVNDVRQLRQ